MDLPSIVYLDPPTTDKLRDLARRFHKSKSAMISEAITHYHKYLDQELGFLG